MLLFCSLFIVFILMDIRIPRMAHIRAAAALLLSACAAAHAHSTLSLSTEWEACKIGGGGYLQRMSIPRANPNRIYLATDIGGAYRSDDAGHSWQLLGGSLPPGEAAHQIRGILAHPDKPDLVLIAAGTQWEAPLGIFLSQDAGASFSLVQPAPFEGNGDARADGDILVADPSSPDTVYAASIDKGLFRSSDFGKTWHNIGLTNLYPSGIVIDRTQPNRIWATAIAAKRQAKTYTAGFFRTDDGGKTWNALPADGLRECIQDPCNPYRLHGLFFRTPQFRYSDDLGKTWLPSPGSEKLPPPGDARSDGSYAALAAGPDFLLAGAHGGTFYRLDAANPDASWQKLPPPQAIHDEGWYARHTQPIEPHFGAALGFIAIAPGHPDRWYFTDWYACYRTDDAGTNWTLAIDGIEMTVVHTLAQDPAHPSRIHAGAADVGYFQSFDNAETFSVWGRLRGISNNIKDIAPCHAAPNRVYAVGPRTWLWHANQLFQSNDAGLHWRRPAMRGLPDLSDQTGFRSNSVCVHPQNPDEVYLAISGPVASPSQPACGGIYRSTDGGENWTRFDQGLPQGIKLFRDSIWTTEREIAVSPDGTLLAFSHDCGRAFRRSPNDAAWSEITGKYGLPASFRSWKIAADPRTPERFFVSLREAGFFETRDGGLSWRKSLDAPVYGFSLDEGTPGRIAVCTPQMVFLSEDDGKTFAGLEPVFPFRSKRSIVCFADDRLCIGTPGSGIRRINLPRKKAPAPHPQTPPVAEILFDAEPIERGLVFDRSFATPDTITVQGKPLPVWRIRQGADSKRGWLRSLRCTLTDPVFMGAKMPVLEGELEYVHTADSSMNILLHTTNGMVRAGTRWGGSPELRTIRFSIDCASFSSDDGAPDLLLQASNADWLIRSLRLRGIDRVSSPDFTRRIPPVDLNAADRPVFLFSPGEQIRLSANLANLALLPFDGTLLCRLQARPPLDSDPRSAPPPVANQTIPIHLPRESRRSFSILLDSRNFPYGIADLKLTLQDKTGKTVNTFRHSIGFSPDAKTSPEKASENEFLYGLDIRLDRADTSPELMTWTRLLGVDLVRTGLRPNRPEEAREIMDNYRREKLRMLAVLDVPKDTDEAAFRKNLAQTKSFAAHFAATEEPPFWELGNEPDLSFFFPAGMPRYLEGFSTLADAIHVADPNTCVLNGGLANASHRKESAIRIREFFEGLARGSRRPDRIAYHAHGPLFQAEQNALARLKQAASEEGLSNLLWVDTETGVAAAGPDQENLQAATCVEKFVFAQREKHPFLIWFRLLFEHPESYGSLLNKREPRPAALAFRQLVRTLRHHVHTAEIQLGSTGIQAHLFQTISADSDKTISRVLVLWNDSTAPQPVRIHLASIAKPTPTLSDLFGNPLPLLSEISGTVECAVSRYPIYLQWTAPPDSPLPYHASPLLELVSHDALDQIAFSDTPQTTGEIIARNPLPFPLDTQISFTPDSIRIPLSVKPSVRKLRIAPHAQARIPFELTAGTTRTDVSFAPFWMLYGPLPDSSLKPVFQFPKTAHCPKSILGIPARLTAPDPVTGVFPLGQFCKWNGSPQTAVLMTTLDAARDTSIRIGASADWWMTWYVNGKEVFTTVPNGNGSDQNPATAHCFDLPLHAGRNLLAVSVHAGSQGFRLSVATPAQVQTAREKRIAPEALHVQMDVPGRTPVRLSLPVIPPISLPEWPENLFTAPIETFACLPAFHPADTVQNLWVTQPDASKWWQGTTDLSARLWMGRLPSGEKVAVLAVTDDKHTKGDFVESFPGKSIHSLDAPGNAIIERVGNTTLYRFRLPDHSPFAPLIHDDDFGEEKQTLSFQ